jgi:hypothetical protein
MLSFDETSHTYTQDGIVVPSATQIISAMIPTEASKYYTEAGRERGKQVHLACELYDEKDLDEETLDPRLIPYLEGWKKFLRETRVTIVDTEHRGASKFGFAGTRDRLAIDHKGDKILIDIKSSIAKPKWIGIQLGFYQQLAEEQGHKISERWSIHLPGDGTFKREHWPDRKNDSLALCRAYQIKMECGGF